MTSSTARGDAFVSNGSRAVSNADGRADFLVVVQSVGSISASDVLL